jgi:hypothetical protein
MDRKANKVEPNLAVFVFVGRIAVNLPVVLRLEWMTTVEVSDVPARLGLKAAALARLLTAQAFETCRPGQSRQIRLALARLWPEPRPVGVKFEYSDTWSYGVN